MAISDLPIFSMLRTRMHWHQERQRVLAENVANADTPNFRPKDLAPLAPGPASGSAVAGPMGGGVTLARTNPGHIASGAGAAPQFAQDRKNEGREIRPAGNAVNLEDEMIKVAANQMDFQAATALYTRSLGLLKTAIGRH